MGGRDSFLIISRVGMDCQARRRKVRIIHCREREYRLAHQRHFSPWLLSHVAAVQAHVELAQGNLAMATRWADASGLSAADDDLNYLREREYLTLARVRIAQGRDDRAGPFLQDALHLLQRLLQDAET